MHNVTKSNAYNVNKTVCSKLKNGLCERVTKSQVVTKFRGIIKGKAGKHVPYPNFETIVIL